MLPPLRGEAAEIEGVASFGREIDFGNKAGLAHGVGPGFPEGSPEETSLASGLRVTSRVAEGKGRGAQATPAANKCSG